MSAEPADRREGPERPIRWAGTRAFLAECPSLADVVALHSQLTASPLPGQREVLAAAQTVLVGFATRPDAVAGARVVATLQPGASAAAAGRTVEIEVVYDGEDLADVGELTGLGVDGVIRAHTGNQWTAAFGGFAPGFAYLVAEGDPLQVPRRGSPRAAVPAGSVALAGNFSAVYPRQSPGGWQLIGRTDAPLWDLNRAEPALIRPGDRVRYRAVRELATVGESPTTAAAGDARRRQNAPRHIGQQGTGEQGTKRQDMGEQGTGKQGAGWRGTGSAGFRYTAPALVVRDPGLQSLVQDLGRPGLGNLGVAASGAADADAARQANRLVGNAPGEAVVETVLGGLSVTARGHLVLALAGAEAEAQITVAVPGTSDDDIDQSPHVSPHEPPAGPYSASRPATRPASRPAPLRAPFALYDGETLTLGEPVAGLRSYLAVRGGLDAPTVLGSRATDVMSGIGPPALSAGTVLAVRTEAGFAAVGNPEELPRRLPAAGRTTELRVVPGPRADWFDDAGRAALTGQPWTVSSESNRIGVRLQAPEGGATLTRGREGELASEGVVAGALQVPPSGLPVLFLADHPVTGGYPVIGVVVGEDLGLAAQLPPGALVRFVLVDPETREPVGGPAPDSGDGGRTTARDRDRTTEAPSTRTDSP